MTNSYPVADAVRVAVLLLGAVLLGQTVLIVTRYGRSYLRSRSTGHHWRGLLPLHVVAIGTSYLLAVASLLLLVTAHFHRPLSNYAAVTAVVIALGIWAQRTLLKHQRLVRDALPGRVREDESLLGLEDGL